MKLTLIFILFTASLTQVFAQDKTVIPPGPNDPTKMTKVQETEIKEKISKFLKLISDRKKICKNNPNAEAELSLEGLYNKLIVMDAVFVACPSCAAKKESSEPKHQKDVQCLFEYKDETGTASDVVSPLKEILENSVFTQYMSQTNTGDSIQKMSSYFTSLVNDYEHQE